jgi:hypothetical protein
MVRKITAALAAVLVLASMGVASARPTVMSVQALAPGAEQPGGWTYSHSAERYCYLPSSSCDNEHRMTN